MRRLLFLLSLYHITASVTTTNVNCQLLFPPPLQIWTLLSVTFLVVVAAAANTATGSDGNDYASISLTVASIIVSPITASYHGVPIQIQVTN